jgi:deazaflavin-dependent oxidoreductase (nitroreductase family)
MPSPIGNAFMKAMINSPLHGLLGERFAVITVTGRKSGRAITTPINVSRDDNSYTVVSTRDRTWWRNLRGDASAHLRNAGRTFTVRGEIIEEPGAVREELQRFFQRYPGDAKYFKIRLTSEGEFDPDGLQRAANEKLIIRLRPSAA